MKKTKRARLHRNLNTVLIGLLIVFTVYNVQKMRYDVQTNTDERCEQRLFLKLMDK